MQNRRLPFSCRPEKPGLSRVPLVLLQNAGLILLGIVLRQDIQHHRRRFFRRLLLALVAFIFIVSAVFPPGVGAQRVLGLPAPGSVVLPTPAFSPVIIKGINLYPENPFKFDFIIDKGDNAVDDEAFRRESTTLIKYFMASLTIPEDQMWVNLSPYEKDRIIPADFGKTEMGRDLLAQDYMLKQLTASLVNPESDLGRKFWGNLYKKIEEQYGTIDVPMDTVNKVWIVPEGAEIYEHHQCAFIVKAHLKVMSEEDYLAAGVNQGSTSSGGAAMKDEDLKAVTALQSRIIKDVIIPEIEKEVNEGRTFSNLRQIYHSMILAAWYKKRLRKSLLDRVYVDKNRVYGVDVKDAHVNEKIYQQYVASFQRGVFNFIKEDYDPVTHDTVPRKYFTGGVVLDDSMSVYNDMGDGGHKQDIQKAIGAAAHFIRVTAGMKEVKKGALDNAAAQSPELLALQQDIDRLFKKTNADAYNQLSMLSIPFYQIAIRMLYFDSVNMNKDIACEKVLQSILPQIYWQDDDLLGVEDWFRAIREILVLVNSHSEDGMAFAKAVGKASALLDIDSLNQGHNVVTPLNLGSSPLQGGVFLDLASGLDFIQFIQSLDPQTQYMAVDRSYFVAAYLSEVKDLLRVNNLEVINEDVLALKRPSRRVGTVRLKNVWHYVEGFGKKLPEIVGWLEEGGQLIIANEDSPSHRESTNRFIEEFARQWIAQGWAFDYTFNDSRSGFDNIIFTKIPDEAKASWKMKSKTWERYLVDCRQRSGNDFLEYMFARGAARQSGEPLQSPHTGTGGALRIKPPDDMSSDFNIEKILWDFNGDNFSDYSQATFDKNLKDQDHAAKGGVDLNAGLLHLKINPSEAGGLNVMTEGFAGNIDVQNVLGFMPIIVGMTPIHDTAAIFDHIPSK